MCKTFDVVELSTQLEGLVASSKLKKLFYDSYLGTWSPFPVQSLGINLTGLFPPTIEYMS